MRVEWPHYNREICFCEIQRLSSFVADAELQEWRRPDGVWLDGHKKTDRFCVRIDWMRELFDTPRQRSYRFSDAVSRSITALLAKVDFQVTGGPPRSNDVGFAVAV